MSGPMEPITFARTMLGACSRRGKWQGVWRGMLALFVLTGIQAARAAEVRAAGDFAADATEAVEVEHGKINTPDASPVDPGQVEIEAGYIDARSTRYWDHHGETWTRGLARERGVTLAATVGLAGNVDVAVGGGYVWLKDEENDYAEDDDVVGPARGDDWGDVDAAVRYRFYASGELNLELAYIAGVTLPAGSDPGASEIGTSQEYWSINQTMVASKDWGRWTANLAFGYALPVGGKREQARGTFSADAALGYQMLPWLQPEIEVNYSYETVCAGDDAAVAAVTAGLVMPVNDRLRINAGVQQGLWGSNADKTTALVLAAKLAF